jgi:transposase InsO family protein
MAYSINPNLAKARRIALLLVLKDKLPVGVVARKCGVNRTTIWRWIKKWRALNENISQDKPGRPTRITSFQPAYYRWSVITESSAPLTHPLAISDEIIKQVLAVRYELRRCAEVVWHHLTHILGICVSLSSVKRIFRRHHVYDRKNGRKRPYHKSLHRPLVLRPGDLVQTDTIHLVDPYSKRRIYVYTVIDLYTRLAYASVHSGIRPGLAANAILKAQAAFGFHFDMVQSDNGLEFSSYFEERLHGQGVKTRHSRLHRPNDNAHIERFNRTIQEECTGSYWNTSVPLTRLQEKITKYLDYYNTKRIHLGIQLRTPAEMLQR